MLYFLIVTVTQRGKTPTISVIDCFPNALRKYYRTGNIFLYFYLGDLLCWYSMYSFPISIRRIVLMVDLRYLKYKYLLLWSASSLVKIYNILHWIICTPTIAHKCLLKYWDTVLLKKLKYNDLKDKNSFGQ